MNTNDPLQVLEALSGAAATAVLSIGLIGALWFSLKLAAALIDQVIEAIKAPMETPKNKFDRFSVPYDQDADDDKPKRREPYVTIGDDGELVEMEE